MAAPVDCPHCQHAFEVREELVGGIANCPRCGKAVEVPGLRDPMWQLAKLAALAFSGFIAWVAATLLGPWGGVLAGFVTLVALWLLSRMM